MAESAGRTRAPSEVTLKDGGMGQELRKRSMMAATPMWSAQMLLDEPELVIEAHRDFILAGAEVITLNSYAVTPLRLARVGLADRFDQLQRAAIEAAWRGRDAAQRDVRIAGCLPPLVASYRPDLAPPEAESRAHFDRIVASEADAVDLFLCETMSSRTEARVATSSAVATGKPVWTALTVADAPGASPSLRSGEAIADGAADAIAAGADAVLINCARPEAVAAGVDSLAGVAPRYGAYANGFTSIDALQPGGTVDVLDARRDLGPEAYAEIALGWVEAGASIIGGCCEIGPAHIAELARRLSDAGYARAA